MKTLIPFILISLFFLGCEKEREKHWYLVPEQRVRFNKLDSLSARYKPLNAQNNEWLTMLKQDASKLDSLSLLIRKNCKEIDRILDEKQVILDSAEAYIDKYPTNRVLKKIFY